MKTMDELMDEIAEKSGNKNFHHACELYRRNEITSSVLARIAKAAAKEYASQAIDRCAESAETEESGSFNGGGEYETFNTVNRESILKIKNELK